MNLEAAVDCKFAARAQYNQLACPHNSLGSSYKSAHYQAGSQQFRSACPMTLVCRVRPLARSWNAVHSLTGRMHVGSSKLASHADCAIRST